MRSPSSGQTFIHDIRPANLKLLLLDPKGGPVPGGGVVLEGPAGQHKGTVSKKGQA